MQPQFFVVDALNICKEGPTRTANLSILLSLLLELTNKGHDFLCIFDESAYAEFNQQGLPTVSGIIFSEELGVQANESTNLEAVWNELKTRLALRARRPGSEVRTNPATPTQEPSVVVVPPAPGPEHSGQHLPTIDEETSRKAMLTRGDDILEQLVAGAFLTPDIAHILQHGIDEHVSVVSTRQNDMVAIVLVVDKSSSMQQWQGDIIDGHKLMIHGLLGAHPKFDLRFGQILFNHKVEYFQPICEFRDKSDPKRASSDVKLLDTQNYKPNGFTALYDAILKGICALAPIFYASQELGFALNSQVCILTDGIDEGIDGHAGSKIPPQQLGQAA